MQHLSRHPMLFFKILFLMLKFPSITVLYYSMHVMCAGTPDMKCPVEAFDLQFLHQQSCVQDLDPPVGSDFLQIAVDYMIHNNVTLPVSVREAVMLYVDLVHLFENILAP